MQRNRSSSLNVGVNFKDSSAVITVVGDGGGIAIAIADAVVSGVTFLSISSFVVDVVVQAAHDEANLLRFGVVRDVSCVVDASSRESRAGTKLRSSADQDLVVSFYSCFGYDAIFIRGYRRRRRRNRDATLHAHEG